MICSVFETGMFIPIDYIYVPELFDVFSSYPYVFSLSSDMPFTYDFDNLDLLPPLSDLSDLSMLLIPLGNQLLLH